MVRTRLGWADRHQIIAASPTAARAQNEAAGNYGRAHAALVERVLVLPQNFAGGWVERGDSMGLTVKNERTTPALIKHAGRGIGNDGALTRRLPDCFSRLSVHGD